MRLVVMTPCPGPLLQAVGREHRIVGVATDDEAPFDRRLPARLRRRWKRARGEPMLSSWAASRNVPVFQYHHDDPDAFGRWLEARRADLLITCKAPLLPESVFSMPRWGSVNVHYSLLPSYRGGSPLLWQVMQGESVGGVTIHYIDAGVDTGPVLAQQPLALPPGASERELDRRLGRLAARMLVDVLPQVAQGAQGEPVSGQRAASPFAANLSHEALLHKVHAERWPVEKLWRVLRFLEFWPANERLPGWARALRWRVGDYVCRSGGLGGPGRPWCFTRRRRSLWLEWLDGAIELRPCPHLPTLVRAVVS